MVIAVFLVINWVNKVKFFEKTILMANINLNIIFEIFFFILNILDVNFLKREL